MEKTFPRSAVAIKAIPIIIKQRITNTAELIQKGIIDRLITVCEAGSRINVSFVFCFSMLIEVSV